MAPATLQNFGQLGKSRLAVSFLSTNCWVGWLTSVLTQVFCLYKLQQQPKCVDTMQCHAASGPQCVVCGCRDPCVGLEQSGC